MFTVYALYSNKYDKLYIGYTTNLEQRVKSHNELARKGFTVKFRLWKLIYSEEYRDKKTALKREKELKSHKGRDFLRTLI